MRITFGRYDELELEAEKQVAQLGDPSQWFPTEAQFNDRLSAVGEDDIRYFLCCASDGLNLTAEQARLQKLIKKALYNPAVVTLVEEDDPALNGACKIKASELDRIEEVIDRMDFKIGTITSDRYKTWYPTEAELMNRIKSYDRTTIIFLIWLTKTEDAKMTEDMIKTKKYIMSLLGDHSILEIMEDESEEGESDDSSSETINE